MAGQLIPLPEHEPPVDKSTTPEERIAAWFDLMRTAEAFLLAGLRHKIGPDGDLMAAYRAWYRHEMDERDRERYRWLAVREDGRNDAV